MGPNVGLDHSRGQIQDLAGSPVDGKIQFPADSKFDIFFDLWIDFGNGAGGAPDGIVQDGEVFSNDVRLGGPDNNVAPESYALTMVNHFLPGLIPGSGPPNGTVYLGDTGILAYDPGDPNNRYDELGTFQAMPPTPLPFLYAIQADRQCLGGSGNCLPFAQLTGQATHEIPEIDAASGTGALSLLAGGLALVGERRRRKAA